MGTKRQTKTELFTELEKAISKYNRLKKKNKKISIELKETKQLYHSLIDLSPEPIFLHHEGIITYVNDATIKLFGVKSGKDLIGRYAMDFIPADQKEFLKAKIKESPNSFRFEPLSFKAVRPDGAEFYLETLASAVPTGKGKSVQVIIRDITKQKKAESELRRVNRSLEALSAINQTLIRAENETIFLEEVCRIICEVGGYIMTWIGYPQDDEEKRVKPIIWKGKEDGYLSLIKITYDDSPYSKGPVGTSIKTGKTCVVQNLEIEWKKPLWKEAASIRGYKSIIALPLKIDNVIIGAIAIYSDQENSFDKKETHLLEKLSDDISFGIKTLRSKEEKNKAEQFLRESEDRYRSLVELSPEAIIVHTEGKIMYANNSTLKYLRASSKEELVGKSMSDLVPEQYKTEIHERMQKAKESTGAIEPLQMKFEMIGGQAVYLEAVGAPVKYLGNPAGQVIIRDITARKLYEEELKVSREQLRNLAAHLQEARETERTHVAREIHDELGQYLTGLKMDISMLKELIEEKTDIRDKEPLLEKIQSASDLLNTTVHSVRKLSSDLRPAVLDNLGLLAAIEWQSEEFQNRMGINCECYLTVDEINLPADHITAIFRIFQESLTNIAKHANATRISIEFRKEDNYYVLEIKDNGKGISEEDKMKDHSFGLIGIRERTHLFGGSAEISGVPGKGTTVSVIIPFK